MKPRKQPTPDLDNIIPILLNQWRRKLEIYGPQDRLQTREFRGVVNKVREMQNGIFDGDSLLGEDYFSDKSLLAAYTLYHWIIHYQQGLSLINEIPEPPKRVLDLCAGPCAFSFAALRHGAEEVIAIDKNLESLLWGAQICGRYGLPVTVRQGDCRQPLKKIEGKFDLIIVAHALREMFPDMEKNNAAATSWLRNISSLLSPNGHLLLVDSPLHLPNRALLKVRDSLVEKGMSIQAPCLFKGPCPALERQDSPCYAQREMEKPFLVSEIQRAASINLSSLKMSYVLFKAPDAAWPEAQPNFYRVISPPFESHQGTAYYLCGPDGKKRINGDKINNLPQHQRAFAHLKRGDLISILNSSERGNTYELQPDTEIKIIAAPGKAFLGVQPPETLPEA
ncbi:MAG: class I SAM-dependent methyltransferase [Parachlamydiales bacterium]|jgi:SAM-dependent methyltransferase